MEIEEELKKKQVGFLKYHVVVVVDVGSRRRGQYQYNQGKYGWRKRDDNILWLSQGQLAQYLSIVGTLC